MPLYHPRRRHPSDMAEAEWAVRGPSLPVLAWLAGRGGRPSRHCMHDIVDAIRYLTHTGPVWRALPADFPPSWTVYWWAGKWEADGSTARMHHDLRGQVRAAAGRTPQPTAAIIDSQSVKGSEMMGPLLWNLRQAFPKIRLAWADGGYAGKFADLVRGSPATGGASVITNGWRPPRNLYWAMIIVMTRRLARAGSGPSSAIAVRCRVPAREPVSCQCRCALRG